MNTRLLNTQIKEAICIMKNKCLDAKRPDEAAEYAEAALNLCYALAVLIECNAHAAYP